MPRPIPVSPVTIAAVASPFVGSIGGGTKAGHVIGATDDFAGMCGNIAFSLSLYSGQMCTTPQNLLIPRDGITTDAGDKTYDEVVADIDEHWPHRPG